MPLPLEPRVAEWQVGYEFGGEVKSPGVVTKTNASAACAAF